VAAKTGSFSAGLGYRTAKAEEIEEEFAVVFQRIVTIAAPER